MFDPSSRYHGLPVLTCTAPTGQTIPYVARRFCPQGDTLPVLAEALVGDRDRLDLVAARTLGNALLAWRIADANDAMDPADLTAEPGRRLRIPVPQA